MSKTIDYYNENAKNFVNDTVAVDFTATQDTFLQYLAPGALILDFGCGSGRDSKKFMEHGYEVDAADGSFEMVKAASEYLGVSVRHMDFFMLNDKEKYDGIWACASILHVEKIRLRELITKMTDALKVGGVIYTSFKYGDFEGERNGRYFTYLTEESFSEIVNEVSDIKIAKMWKTRDVRAGREDEEWLNIILKKI